MKICIFIPTSQIAFRVIVSLPDLMHSVIPSVSVQTVNTMANYTYNAIFITPLHRSLAWVATETPMLTLSHHILMSPTFKG